MYMPYSKETVIHKAQRAVKLTDSELTIVLSDLLHTNQSLIARLEELENEVKKLSVSRSTSNKTTKRNVSTTRVSREGDS